MSRELSVGFLSLGRERKGGLSVNSDKIQGHGKETLRNQSFVIYMLYILNEPKCGMTIF